MESEAFVAATALVFGALAWAQMPAVCGFMLSSTLAGAANYIYSIWLGVIIAAVGVGAATGSLLRGNRRVLAIVGTAASVGFLLSAAFAHAWYGTACRAVYEALTPR